ncbi:MAG: hypothetical protein SFX73_22015 [Kofleriaceae bacterium]|nr:hypothetical protein [Kofleriaceae bacterium]
MSTRERVILLADDPDEEPTEIGAGNPPPAPTRAPAQPPPLPASVRRLSPREVRELKHVVRVMTADRIAHNRRLADVADMLRPTAGALPTVGR